MCVYVRKKWSGVSVDGSVVYIESNEQTNLVLAEHCSHLMILNLSRVLFRKASNN